MRDTFASYHPVINFTFFIGAFVSGMILLHPGFLLCSITLSTIYYLTVRGSKGIRYITGMLGMWVVLSLINPLFSPYGETVLFTYFGKRPYTLEALLYGIVLAAMVVTIMIWFASYNEVMTSDKFLYLFSRLAPSATLVFTMVLRLVPSYKQKVIQMNGARRCIGKAADNGSKREKAEHGLVILSALTSWALEGGVITSDSMRNRGYGCGKRTTFSIYRFEGRDKIMLSVMIVLLGILLFCCINGASSAAYLPELKIGKMNSPYTIVGLLAYFAFLMIPSAVNIWEEIRWHNLKSKI